MQDIEEVSIPAGTLIKISGIPFRLKDDIVVLGRQSNYELAMEIEKDLLPRCSVVKDKPIAFYFHDGNEVRELKN